MDSENSSPEAGRENRPIRGQEAREGDSVPRRAVNFLTYEDLYGLLVIIRELYPTPEGGTDLLKEKGVEGRSLLEAALGNPELPYHVDIADQAAGLFWSLIKNHGLNDGNKRLALVATHLFLAFNHCALLLSDTSLQALALAVAEGNLGRPEIREKFRPYLFDSTTTDLETFADQAIAQGVDLQLVADLQDQFREWVRVLRAEMER